jgi:hypothetical protein
VEELCQIVEQTVAPMVAYHRQQVGHWLTCTLTCLAACLCGRCRGVVLMRGGLVCVPAQFEVHMHHRSCVHCC